MALRCALTTVRPDRSDLNLTHAPDCPPGRVSQPAAASAGRQGAPTLSANLFDQLRLTGMVADGEPLLGGFPDNALQRRELSGVIWREQRRAVVQGGREAGSGRHTLGPGARRPYRIRGTPLRRKFLNAVDGRTGVQVRIASSQTGLTGSVIAVVLDGAEMAAQKPLVLERLRTSKKQDRIVATAARCGLTRTRCQKIATGAAGPPSAAWAPPSCSPLAAAETTAHPPRRRMRPP